MAQLFSLGDEHHRVKTKKTILCLAVCSILLVLGTACSHLSQAWIDSKLMTIVKPDDQRYERLSDDKHQNIGMVIDDALVVVAQGVIIFLTFKVKHDRVA